MVSLIFSIICSAVTLDIILAWNTWKNLTFSQILRNILKFAVALVWAVVLPIGYFSSLQNSTTGLAKFFSGLAWDWMNRSFYNFAVLLYLIPNSVSVVLFFLPHLRRCIERSNRISFLMWWAQACLAFDLSCLVVDFLL